MLRSLFAFAIFAASASASAQGGSFEFFGFSPEVPAPAITDLAGKKFKVSQSGLSQCRIFAGAVIGRARPIDLRATFNNARLVMVTGVVVGSFYDDLLEAFAAKYGPASDVSNQPWQNRLGLTFDNTVHTWRFSNGTLQVHQRGQTRDASEFMFQSKTNLPAPVERGKPPVNF